MQLFRKILLIPITFLSIIPLSAVGMEAGNIPETQVNSSFYNTLPMSPTSVILHKIPAPSNQGPKTILGFEPYWELNNVNNLHFKQLSVVAYFGINIDSNGNIVTNDKYWEGFQSSALNHLLRTAHAAGTKVVLTVRPDTANSPVDSTIAGITNSDDIRTKVILNLLRVSTKFDGLNVDFESMNPALRDNFSTFINELTTKSHQNNANFQISVDTMATAVIHHGMYDIPTLYQTVDYLVVMAYDYTPCNSSTPGSVAPLSGGWYNVSSTVEDYIMASGGDSTKLILGEPYYGCDWTITTGIDGEDMYSHGHSITYSAAIDHLQNALSSINNPYASIPHRDPDSSEFWYAYKDPIGNIHLVTFDDQDSLQAKDDYVKQMGLMGVGIWALGNDGAKPELWQILAKTFA